MTVVIEGAEHVLTLDDELVVHDCPLHRDVEIGDLTLLNVYERKWIDLACKDLRFHEEGARLYQERLRDLTDADPGRRSAWRGQMHAAIRACERIRAEMHRTIARAPRPEISGPHFDLWAR